MDAIQLLHTRNSVSVLNDPAPDSEAMELILAAALRAPDHARLRPWRFLTIEGEARSALGQLFVEAENRHRSDSGELPMDLEASAKLAAKPLRAPLLLVVIASIVEHPKVPEVEQLLSAGCAAHAVLLAAHALGYGAMWRTGGKAYDATVKSGLGLADNEQLIGYIYLGTPAGYKSLPAMNTGDFVKPWGKAS